VGCRDLAIRQLKPQARVGIPDEAAHVAAAEHDFVDTAQRAADSALGSAATVEDQKKMFFEWRPLRWQAASLVPLGFHFGLAFSTGLSGRVHPAGALLRRSDYPIMRRHMLAHAARALSKVSRGLNIALALFQKRALCDPRLEYICFASCRLPPAWL
jgi:hypothetical protein